MSYNNLIFQRTISAEKERFELPHPFRHSVFKTATATQILSVYFSICLLTLPDLNWPGWQNFSRENPIQLVSITGVEPDWYAYLYPRNTLPTFYAIDCIWFLYSSWNLQASTLPPSRLQRDALPNELRFHYFKERYKNKKPELFGSGVFQCLLLIFTIQKDNSHPFGFYY